MRSLRLAGSLLMLAGACLSARALYLRGKATLATVLIRLAWDETLRTGRETRPWPWADTHPIGRLMIPRLGFDEVLVRFFRSLARRGLVLQDPTLDIALPQVSKLPRAVLSHSQD